MGHLTDEDFEPQRVAPQIPLGKPRRNGHRAGLLLDPHVSKEEIATAVTSPCARAPTAPTAAPARCPAR